jgi:NADPH-dependent glutamate synthase beta subunit-like oxidoreductase
MARVVVIEGGTGDLPAAARLAAASHRLTVRARSAPVGSRLGCADWLTEAG